MAEYIRREDYCEENCGKENREGYKTCTNCGMLNVPSADVQPVKRGKWLSTQRTVETGTVYCSNCAIEYYISALQTVGDCNGIVHYCPNCGARMDGDTDA